MTGRHDGQLGWPRGAAEYPPLVEANANCSRSRFCGVDDIENQPDPRRRNILQVYAVAPFAELTRCLEGGADAVLNLEGDRLDIRNTANDNFTEGPTFEARPLGLRQAHAYGRGAGACFVGDKTHA